MLPTKMLPTRDASVVVAVISLAFVLVDDIYLGRTHVLRYSSFLPALGDIMFCID